MRSTGDWKQELRSLVSKGWAAACRQTHARILLLSDENQADGAMKGREIARGSTRAPPLRGRGSGGYP